MIQCNRGCGASNLRWKVIDGKYKLFNYNDLLHICNDGVQASEKVQEQATAAILAELGLSEARDIPEAEPYIPKNNKVAPKQTTLINDADPSKMFTITSTASGLAITGDDKHNAIYLPKIAVPEIIKALVDFM